MKKTNKIISLLSAASIAPLIATPILTSCSQKQVRKEKHIISINDIHGAMAGYGEDVVDVSSSNPGCLRLAREINKVTKKYPDTLVVSAGDENSGDCWSVCDHANTTYPILKSMGIRYAAVGNHAFEWGLDDIASGHYDRLARTDKTEGKYFVASNILNSSFYQTKEWCTDPSKSDFISDFTTWQNQRVKWADPYKIVKFDNAKVCLIGLATQNTLVDGNKKVTSQFSFIDYNTCVNYTKYLIKQELGEQEFKHIDSFILLTHCDSDYTNNELSGEAVRLAGSIDTDIDAIISAHSHKVGCGRIWNNILNKPIWVGQAGTAGRYYLDTKLTVNPKGKIGKKITDISMSVNQVPIPKTKEEAIAEWNQLQVSDDPQLVPVVNEYANQKVIVEEKVGEQLTSANLDTTKEGETQTDKSGKPFDGYYNGLLESGKKIGHEYYDCKAILDHLGGWACRAIMLGYAIERWEDILAGNDVIPSAAFLSQDSLPASVKNGPITFKDMFALQPYDNYGHIGYVSIMQLANIINYILAGNPEIGKLHSGTGFSYTDKHQYEPDLCYYNAVDNSGNTQSYQVAYNITDDKGKPVINSGYVCGVMPFYGIKIQLKEISEKDREYKFINPVTGIKSPFYDPSAEYRLDTKDYTIGGKTVTLPVMWVYDSSNDGKGIKWGKMDRADDPDDWKPADWWYEQEHPAEGVEPRLIPVLYNSFNYGGGNTQTRMFKQYADFNVLNYGLQFYSDEAPETIRDYLVSFCRNSHSEVREWAEYTIPTNIVWKDITRLVQYA